MNTMNILKSIRIIIKLIISFDLRSGASSVYHAFYKRNTVVQLLTHRYFLYSMMICLATFLWSKNSINMLDPKISFLINFIAIILCSTLVPSFICSFKPFQGYGPPLHYIEFFTPFIIIFTSSLFLNYVANSHFNMINILYALVRHSIIGITY